MTDKEIEQAFKIEEQKRENLLSKLEQAKENINFKLTQIEKSIDSVDNKLKNDVKTDIWEIKQSVKNISQYEKDIAVLSEQFKSITKQLESYKKELEAKMITTKDLEDKKYKDWRLWLSIIAILIAILSFLYKQNTNTSMEKHDVPTNTQK